MNTPAGPLSRGGAGSLPLRPGGPGAVGGGDPGLFPAAGPGHRDGARRAGVSP